MQTATKSFQVGPVTFGDGRLTVIAGPCVIESEAHATMMARECAQRARDAGLDFVFKTSFDKANRSSIKSFRGIGMETGLEILRAIKNEIGVPVITDIHEISQVQQVAEVADVLQIPAFLCRQTDLITEAAKSGRAVNIKKGQFLAPEDARNIVEKAQAAGCERLMITERGVSFGYNNLVVDMRSFPIMGFGVPVVFDVTHSPQLPGAWGMQRAVCRNTSNHSRARVSRAASMRCSWKFMTRQSVRLRMDQTCRRWRAWVTCSRCCATFTNWLINVGRRRQYGSVATGFSQSCWTSGRFAPGTDLSSPIL
jgi:2-dehydro-3-deoxyphosphooctonate aldolase (KDO 8-P synthase)